MNKFPLDTETLRNIDPNLKELLSELVTREVKYQSLNFYSGKVIDNNDPLKIGRCKIRVFGIYDDMIADSDLPWALPDDHFVGSFKGSLVIPPKEALVRVYFDHGDIYAPVYTSKIPEKKYKSEHISKDYPDTMLFFETDNGDYFTINRKKAEIVFHAAGGSLITIDNKGNLTIDTTEADVIYGGGFKLDIVGDVEMKTVGNVTIDAVGPPVIPPMINPFEEPVPGESIDLPRTLAQSRNELKSTGQTNLITLGIPAPACSPDPIPDPKNPTEVQMAVLNKQKTGAINIITGPLATGKAINIMAMGGNIELKSITKVDVTAPEVDINAPIIKLGKGATDALIKSNSFASFFDAHTHATPTGPSSPPVVPMTPQLATLVSPITKTA